MLFMQTIKRIFAIFLILCAVQMLPAGVSKSHAQDPVEEIMSRMSVEDKVGQLFLVPFVGSNVNPGSEAWQLVTEYKVGGIILLAANSNFNNDPSAPRQITEIANTLKTNAFHTNGIPLFVALDHEGEVDRLERIYKERHLERLRAGVCDPLSGVLFAEILHNLERAGDHTLNIACDVMHYP